jgi:hypothetical protein
MTRKLVLALPVAAVVALGCSTRGPVDRSIDTVHATNRTVGESAETVTKSTGNVVVEAITFPFRLVGRAFNAMFG